MSQLYVEIELIQNSVSKIRIPFDLSNYLTSLEKTYRHFSFLLGAKFTTVETKLILFALFVLKSTEATSLNYKRRLLKTGSDGQTQIYRLFMKTISKHAEARSSKKPDQ